MAYDDLKVLPGKEKIDVVVLHLEGCALDFGATNGFGTCPATGEPCHQGWATCKAQEAYVPTDFPVTLCTPLPELPLDALPFLKGVSHQPAEPDPEATMGKRSVARFSFYDAPHDDVGIDPYIASRSYNALTRSTFWPKLRARFPYYQSRLIEWYTGYVHDSFSLANLKKRTFVIESLAGWGRGTDVQIVSKDILKLADDERAVYPIKSTGTLATVIDESTTPTLVDIVTNDTDEYDIESWEPTGVFRIGSECFQYTTVDKVSYSEGVRLTGITRSPPTPYETEKASHDIGDEVQKCAWFYSMKPIDVYNVLLEDGAGIDAATFIPYSDWEDENDTWLAGFRITRLVTSPEGVSSHINEIIPQAGTWGLWFDDEDAEIKYRVTRPADVGETVATWNEEDTITEKGADAEDEPDRVVNEVYIAFDQRDPTKKKDEASNYRTGISTARLASQTAREIGQRRLKTIFGRWSPSGNRAELIAIADRILASRSYVPIRLEFEIERKDDNAKLAQFVDITSMALIDAFGVERPDVRFRIVKATANGDTMNVVAREDFFSAYFARWAPDTIANGLEWDDATEDQQEQYLFWADTDGTLGADSDPGKNWL